MATQASLDQIQNLYIAFYGRPADLAGQTYWADELEAANGDLTAIIDAFASSEEYDSQYGDLTNEELVNALYQQILGRDAEQGGLDFYVGELEAGNITKGGIALAILNGATGDDATVLENRKEVADTFTAAVEAGDKEYGDDQLAAAKALLAGVDAETDTASVDVDAVVDAFPTAEEPVEPGTPGEEFMLTASTDVLTGTENDDTFTAYMSQNEFVGGVSNTLSSADRIDGGEGNDSLYAELVPEFFGATGDNQIDVQPRINNVEEIAFEVRDSGSNDGEEDNPNTVVTVDAKKIVGVDSIGSQQSDGDLVIENLTTLDNDGTARNTSEITITMDHTDNFNSDDDASDLTVYFDEDYLLAGQDTTTSQANYWLLDEDSVDYETAPLLNIERDGVTLTIDGTPVEIRMDEATAAAADTWEAFAAGLQAAIDQLVADGETILEDVSVIVDEDNTDETYNDQGVLVTIPAITLVDAQGRDLTPTGFTSPEEATGAFDIYGRFDNVESEMVDQPVSVNVDLHKVGRHGEGGNLVVGGKSQDAQEGEGIEVFNISVLGDEDKPSNLGRITSTNGALETINIETASEYVGGDTHASLTIRGEAGDLDAEGGATPFGGTVDMINAASFLGDLTIGNEESADNVNTLTATGGGDVYFNADITEDGGVFNYTTGAGEDTIIVDLDGDSVDTIGESLTINTGAADDSVTLNNTAGVSQPTSADLENVTINTGSGEDKVDITGDMRAQVNAGSDSDFVEIQGGNAGSWTFGQSTGSQNFGERVLYQAELTVTFAGFESTVAIDTDANGNFVADQKTINAAIKEAIDSNPELARLLSYSDSTGNQALTVSSTVGGLNDLAVTIDQPEVVESGAGAGQVNIDSNTLTALVQGLIDTTTLDSDDLETAAEVETELGNAIYGGAQFDGNIDANGAAGADYAAFSDGGSTDDALNVNFSVVNMGTGANDLVAFDSNDNSANVLEITEAFGKVSVVNFHDISPNDVTDINEVGNHALDFTAFLDNQTDPSATTNTQSAEDIAITLNTNAQLANSAASTGTALANSVNMLNYDETVANSISFADLTAANLVAALNGDAGTAVTGGLVEADLEAVASTANLIGDVQKHIVMIENDENKGEYKVFYLTSQNDDNDGGDFDTATAQLLGTLDFGASINFQLVGSGTWETIVEGLMESASYATTIAGFDEDADHIVIADTLANILNEANGGSAVLAAAESISITEGSGSSDLDGEEITLTGLDATTTPTAIDFADDAATMSYAELAGIVTSAGLDLTAGDDITVTGGVDTQPELSLAGGNAGVDTVELDDGATITLSAAQLNAITADIAADADGTGTDAALTINTLDSATVAGTDLVDTFVVANSDTGVTINDFVSADDTVQLGGTDAAVALAVADIDGTETLIFDTAANLGANAVSIGDQSGGSAVNWAVASDTGVVYYDADGNWTAGVVTVGTVNADALVASDFLVG